MTYHAYSIIELVENNSENLSEENLIIEVQKIMDSYATSVIQELIEKLKTQTKK